MDRTERLALVADAGVLGAHADYRRADFITPRSQREWGSHHIELEKSPPPIRRGIAWLALYVIAGVAAIGGAVWAWVNRAYPKRRAF